LFIVQKKKIIRTKKNKKKLNTLTFLPDRNVEVHVRFNFKLSLS